MASSKVLSYSLTGGGILLCWSAIQGKAWSGVFRDIIAGKDPTKDTAIDTDQITTGVASAADNAFTGSGTTAPQAPAAISKNVQLGKLLAAPYGWSTGDQWNSLYALWERESGWSNTAENSTSGAYGIAQALGHGPTNQYPAGPANPPVSSASAQILWGLGYIKHAYGNPVNAWAHETSAGWY